MDFCRYSDGLLVPTHGPARQHDNDRREHGACTATADPDTHGTTSPPYHAHQGMLKILVRPGSTVMLGK